MPSKPRWNHAMMTFFFRAASRLPAFFAALALSCLSLQQASAQRSDDVLVIGDSLLWWNSEEEASIGDVISDETGRFVDNRAVPGFEFSEPRGEDVRSLYENENWDWVVINGGANDVSNDCGCGRCLHIIDDLIAPSSRSGEYPTFVKRVLRSDAKVIVLGYFFVPPGGEFDGCEEEIGALNSRLKTLANRTNNLWYASGRSVINARNLRHFDSDRIHPSPLGSARIGKLLASIIDAH